MTPPVGTKSKGSGFFNPPPPKDYYSPQTCANCHNEVGSPSAFEPLNPQKLTFLPSPSDCSAEIYWPDALKVPQSFVQRTPYLKSQNYLQTLLLSRQEQLPLEINDSSLGFYLGLKGPVTLPKGAMPITLQIPHAGGICAGPSTGSGSELGACTGLQVQMRDDDIEIPLNNLDLLSGQDLEIASDLAPWLLPGGKVAKVTIRDGRLFVSFQLSNPLLNSSIAFIKKLSPNPYNPELYDFDATDLALKKLPVAYDPTTREGLNYEAYQANSNKAGLKTIPFLFNIVRQGKLPDRLSLNQLYEAVSELLKNVKKKAEKKDETTSELLSKLIEKIAIQANLNPHRLMTKNLYVDFENSPGKNLFQTRINVQNLKDWDVLSSSSLQINHLFAPGAIDISKLQADLGVQLSNKGESEFRLDNLDLELGQLEYLRTNPDKPGAFAILGGRIRSPFDFSSIPLLAIPTIRVKGNLQTGFEVEANLGLEGIHLRLPSLGEVYLSGDLSGKLRLIPQSETIQLETGESQEVTHWVPEPNSLHLSLKNVDFKTDSGLHLSGGTIELYDDAMLAAIVPTNQPSYLSLRAQFPKIEGGTYQSLQINGDVALVKTVDGVYDFKAILKDVATELTMHAQRADGNQEDWKLDVSGSHQPEATHFTIALDSNETNNSGKIQRHPIEQLKIRFDRESFDNSASYDFHLNAKQLDFPILQLFQPTIDLKVVAEVLKPGLVRYVVPDLNIAANPWKFVPKRGDLRGPFWLKSMSPNKKPLTFEINTEDHTFDLNNLNLGFGAIGITDPKLIGATKGRITGVDIDGSLRGHWLMDYLNYKGKGELNLAGDGEGDVHLRGSDRQRLTKVDPRDSSRLVEIPIISNTSWKVWRIDGIDFENERINGNFQLSTEIDPAAARVFGIIIEAGKLLRWTMNHDHLPYTPKGYTKKMEEYLSIKAQQENKPAEKTSKPQDGVKTP